MNISLVFPPFYLHSMYNLPPLGLLNLATGLSGSGHRTRVHDFTLALRTGDLAMGPSIYEDCAQTILADGPDVVGFAAQCTTYPAVIQIATRLRRQDPKVRIVVGGHNASFVDERTLARFSCIDAVIRGEGEITFAELIAAYAQNRDMAGIEGITYRAQGQIIRNPDRCLIEDLDELPLTDYSFVPPLSVYRDACELPRAIAVLEVGRGCPHACVYCSESILWRRKTRTFSVPRLIREMHHLIGSGAECFLLAYDQFTAKRGFVQEFCDSVIAEGLNQVPWYCISRLDTVDGPLLSLMRQAGCESMCYGIDSGSKRTLAFINKRIDPDILLDRVQETTDTGIVPTLSFVIGFPEEKREDIDQTLVLLLKCGVQGNSNPLLQMPTVLPGTRLHQEYKEKLVRGVDTYFALGMEFERGKRLPSDDRLIDQDPELFSSFYNVPCPGMDLHFLHRLSSFFPLLASLYPKSFLLLSLATDQSPSRLFFDLLERIHEAGETSEEPFSTPLCARFFPGFAERKLGVLPKGEWAHLLDIVRYESAGLEAGYAPCPPRTGNIDLTGFGGTVVRAPGARVHEFAFDLPAIVEDLRAEIYRPRYPEQPSCLVFLHDGEELEITEINEFGKELMKLCNGRRGMSEIARLLYERYGENTAFESFAGGCRDAVETMSAMGILDVSGGSGGMNQAVQGRESEGPG
ncbi:MAG: B12-binding domain-containing radical SAM protein [Desulfovibrionales bacterium]